ncbi:MAG TPA: AI-2E family transporter, partial [Pirellulales bacterium]|nr:AI-2E family transporter [Pirellulales bacterium]
VLFYLFAGIVLATALKPVIAAVMRLRVSHQVATFLVHGGLVAILAGAAALGLPLIAEEATSLFTALPDQYESARQRLIDARSELLVRLGSALPSNLETANQDLNTQLNLSTVAKAFTWGVPVLHGVFMLAAVLLLSFFWSIQEERTLRSVLLWLPPTRRDEARAFFDAAQLKLGAYVRGQAILCAAVGTLSLIAYLIIGLPNPVALAGIAGILESVPVFGPTLGAVPAILVAINVDPMLAVWVVVAAIVIQQSENYVLAPRVMISSVGVNPLVTLLAIAAFTGLLGLPGAILAIPMAAVVQLVLERSVLEPAATVAEPPIGRGAVGRLQYHVRELLNDARRLVRHKDEQVSEETDRIEEAIETIAEELAEKLSAAEPAASVETPSGNVRPDAADPSVRPSDSPTGGAP